MSIIPTENTNIEVFGSVIDPRAAAAKHALVTRKVQLNVIREHKGKGGKLFSYVPHTSATETMLDAFGQLWDWEVIRHDVFADGSAVAYGKMTVYYYDPAGILVHRRTVQEVGAREPITDRDGKIVAPTAFTVLGAASRSLLRCMMRAFGYGLELYKEDEQDFTIEQAFKVLEDYARTQGLKNERQRWVDAIKALGITRENMLDRFEEAYKAVYDVGVQFKAERREQAEKEAEEKRKRQKELKEQQELKAKLKQAHEQPETEGV